MAAEEPTSAGGTSRPTSPTGTATRGRRLGTGIGTRGGRAGARRQRTTCLEA